MKKPPTGEPYAGKPPVRFGGRGRSKPTPTPITMTLTPHEFIRPFLIHVLPKGFHRIRHAACPGQVGSPTRVGGLLANANRAASIARARELLAVAPPVVEPEKKAAAEPGEPRMLPCPCPRCGSRMIVIEVFARGETPRHRPSPKPAPIRIDTS